MPDKCQRAAASPPNSHRIIVGIEFLFFKIASKLSETNDQLIRGEKKKKVAIVLEKEELKVS